MGGRGRRDAGRETTARHDHRHGRAAAAGDDRGRGDARRLVGHGRLRHAPGGARAGGAGRARRADAPRPWRSRCRRGGRRGDGRGARHPPAAAADRPRRGVHQPGRRDRHRERDLPAVCVGALSRRPPPRRPRSPSPAGSSGPPGRSAWSRSRCGRCAWPRPSAAATFADAAFADGRAVSRARPRACDGSACRFRAGPSRPGSPSRRGAAGSARRPGPA